MSFYTYQADSVLHTLPQKTQLYIEYLRTHELANLIKSGQAHIHNTLINPPEYSTYVPALNLKLHYFEQYTFPHEIVIFHIDHPAKQNGHTNRP